MIVQIFPEQSRRNPAAFALEFLNSFRAFHGNCREWDSGMFGFREEKCIVSRNLITRVGRCLIVAVATLVIVSCSRARTQSRVARSRMPMPAPPSVTEGPDSEVPLSLPASETLPGSRTGSAYGPATGISVAPLGSTGTSRDIRFPQTRGPRLRPLPMEPPRSAPSSSSTATEHQPVTAEAPVNVPAAPNRNGTNGKATANDRHEAAAAKEEAPGIPGYLVVESNIATGGQPTFEGMKWLKERGFKTVLNLLPDSEADPAEAGMVRQLGLEYLSIAITPRSINANAVNQFNDIAGDVKQRPLFIHDSTGSRTGAMWYLYRVTVDKTPDDRARNQAARIGLKDTDTELWLAIQRFQAEKE